MGILNDSRVIVALMFTLLSASSGSAQDSVIGTVRLAEGGKIHVGSVFPGATDTYRVVVQNDLNQAASIEKVGTSCRCAFPEVSNAPIPPGEQTTIQVAMVWPKRYGETGATISLFVSGKERPVKFQILGQVEDVIAPDMTDKSLTLSPERPSALYRCPLGSSPLQWESASATTSDNDFFLQSCTVESGEVVLDLRMKSDDCPLGPRLIDVCLIFRDQAGSVVREVGRSVPIRVLGSATASPESIIVRGSESALVRVLGTAKDMPQARIVTAVIPGDHHIILIINTDTVTIKSSDPLSDALDSRMNITALIDDKTIRIIVPIVWTPDPSPSKK